MDKLSILNIELIILAIIISFLNQIIPQLNELNLNSICYSISEPISIESSRSTSAKRDISTNADRVYVYLKEKGLTSIQVAAIMGNIEQESSFDEKCIEEGNGIGFGLIQWSFGRRTELENRYSDPSNIYNQLDFLLEELDYQWTSGRDIFYNSDDLTEVTKAFCWGFERPNKYYANELYRIKMAHYYYELYK